MIAKGLNLLTFLRNSPQFTFLSISAPIHGQNRSAGSYGMTLSGQVAMKISSPTSSDRSST